MYNNDVTYHDKWDTPENKAAYEKLDKKYFDRSHAAPSCPVSWAPEVLELLELLDKELGIARNTVTMRSWYVQGNWVDWFIKDPWKNLFSSINTYLIQRPKFVLKYSRPMRIVKVIQSFFHPIGYAFKAIRTQHYNRLVNYILKPKLTLSQVKEKYGSLNVYFNCPPAFDEYVNNEIKKTHLKLAIKGCYHPVDTFWNASTSYHVGNEYRPDVVEVTKGTTSLGEPYISVTKTTYRDVMQELGLDLKEIEKQYLERKAKETE